MSGVCPSPSPHDILGRVFGYRDFRGHQEAVIAQVIAGGDALVVMPTGSGKSLCYQVPALIRPGVAVVVSPLIALMEDQVAALGQLGVRARVLNSTLTPAAARAVERALVEGALDLVYVAPERAVTERFLATLGRARLALFAIDEAHCVSQWGHDFRPEYRRLQVLGERFPGVPRLALTATADAATRQDILAGLGLTQARVFVASFDRPNIRYRVAAKNEPLGQLMAFIASRHSGEAGIVYRLSRADVERTQAALAARGVRALAYHAGLDAATRAARQARFLDEDGTVMVATVAFGMGIDKPDVRFVAHLDLPRSLEAYYQETGRAGRDGAPAEAWMAYGLQDIARLRHFIATSQAPEAQKRIEAHKLERLIGYCETARCRRQVLLEYFGEHRAEACGNCDTCLEPPETFDGTEAARVALSCIWRTGQRFGVNHVIDVLSGSASERVRRFGHDRLRTFGMGRGRSRGEWRAILRQLAALGLIEVDIAGHGALRLNESCRAVLRGEKAVSLRRAPATRKPRGAGSPGGAELALGAEDAALFEALRAWRRRAAKAQGIPAYAIFHDRSLVEIARRRPASREALADLSGIGAAKIERYGEAILRLVAQAAG